MGITFDPKKDASNIRKHGVSLAEAGGVLSDPMALTVSALGEQRLVAIGANVFGQLRVVVFTFRGDDERIISVRKPEPREVRAYEKGI